jgi:alpha-mannosidase
MRTETRHRTVYMIGNAHLDPVWLWVWPEGYQEARATFRSALRRMEEYPDFVFTCDQVVLLAWVEESDPELFARIRERVAEGRWQNVGGWWVEPDCNLPAGESFVRQGLYGQRYLLAKFGVPATVGMNADPFGHHAMLPQILRGQGLDSYCFLRPGPEESTLQHTAFWWEAPDGSRVLAYRIPHEYCSCAGDLAAATRDSLSMLERRLGDAMVFYGVGDHGGGPTRANIDSIHRYDRMGSFGRLVMAAPRRYFDELAARGEQLPVWGHELNTHAPGCYTAHSGIKMWQRRAQAAILAAERWAAVGAARFGVEYPVAELGHAWRQILFNQFHDILGGSAIEPAYDDARDQLGEAVAIAQRITTRTHSAIARRVGIPSEAGTQPLLVFNPHPWPVTAQVEVQSGAANGVHVVDSEGAPAPSQPVQPVATLDGRHAIAFEAVLPPLGYRTYRLRPGPASPAPSPLHASPTVLENELLRAEFAPATGWLSSLLDKRSGVDVLRGARGEHTLIRRDPTDTWGHHVVSYRGPGEPMRTARATLREAGPLRARLRVEREFGRSTMVEEFVLGARSDALEVRVTLDWREPGHLMKLCFPLAVAEPLATYEIPFGAIERPVDGREYPGQSWVDVTGTIDGAAAGLAVVNDAKHGYDVTATDDGSVSIGITAVRSPVYAWHDPRQLDAGEFYTHQDQGVQAWRYLLVPHGDDWRGADLFRRAAELSMPVRAMLESSHPGPLPARQGYVTDGAGHVLITAVKGWEDGGTAPDLIVRAVETTGQPVRARLKLPLLGRVIEAEFGAWQLRTFRVPLAGGAVREVDLLERDLGGPGRPLRDGQ